jgi:hypothetical protein
VKNRFLFVFVAVWLALMAYKIFNQAAEDGEHFFQNLSAQKIKYIEIVPLGGNSPIHRFVMIDGSDELSRFVAAWNGSHTIIANHPKDIWSVTVAFHADKGVYSGVLRATSNQGVIFDFNGSPTGWPVASAYLLMKSRQEVEGLMQDANRKK